MDSKTVKKLSDKEVFEKMLVHIEGLKAYAPRQWRKMRAVQKATYCRRPFLASLSDHPLSRALFGQLFRGAIKKAMYKHKTKEKGMPTAPALRINDERDVEDEQSRLQWLVTRFLKNGTNHTGRFQQSSLGRYRSETWGKMEWNRLDHHLCQFNA